MQGLVVGPGGDSSPLVEVSTGNIVEPDFNCYAMSVDAAVFVRATEDGKPGIYLRGRRDPILKLDPDTLPMGPVGRFSQDGTSFVGMGGVQSPVVFHGDLAEIRRQLRGFPLGW
jgi:hypothetical protein